MSADQVGGAPAQRGGTPDGRRWADAQAAPWPFIRWVAVVVLMIGRWAAGIPANITGWLGVLAIAGALILPDVAGIAFAGVRVELRRVRERQVETEGGGRRAEAGDTSDADPAGIGASSQRRVLRR